MQLFVCAVFILVGVYYKRDTTKNLRGKINIKSHMSKYF